MPRFIYYTNPLRVNLTLLFSCVLKEAMLLNATHKISEPKIPGWKNGPGRKIRVRILPPDGKMVGRKIRARSVFYNTTTVNEFPVTNKEMRKQFWQAIHM